MTVSLEIGHGVSLVKKPPWYRPQRSPAASGGVSSYSPCLAPVRCRYRRRRCGSRSSCLPSPLSPPCPSTGAMVLTTWGSSSWWSLAAHAYQADHRVHRQVFQGAGDLHWIGGLGLVDGAARIRASSRCAAPGNPLAGLGLVLRLGERVHRWVFRPAGVPFGHQVSYPSLACDTASTVPGSSLRCG